MNARRAKIAVGVVAACIGVAAPVLASGGDRGTSTAGAIHPAAFAWVHPSSLPVGWSAQRLPGSPARLPAPTSWHPAAGDPGTRTALLRGPSGEIAGYLNATPRQGEETPSNWSTFRVDHNRDEGERGVRLVASATGLRFRRATGSCVMDDYTTASDHRYREVACIVSGRSATTVMVGAAPPRRWQAEASTIERAISSFTT